MDNNFIINDYSKIPASEFENIDNKISDLKKGDVLEAVVEESGDRGKVKLKFENGVSVKVDSKLIKGNVGDAVKIEVKENYGGKLVLKNISNDKTNYSSSAPVVNNKIADSYSSMLSKINLASSKENLAYAKFLTENNVEVQVENIRTLKEIKRNVEYIAKNADSATLEKVISNGVDIGKLSPDILSSFIYEIKNNKMDVGYDDQFLSDIDAEIIADEYIKDLSDENIEIKEIESAENEKKEVYEKDKIKIEKEEKFVKNEKAVKDEIRAEKEETTTKDNIKAEKEEEPAKGDIRVEKKETTTKDNIKAEKKETTTKDNIKAEKEEKLTKDEIRAEKEEKPAKDEVKAEKEEKPAKGEVKAEKEEKPAKGDIKTVSTHKNNEVYKEIETKKETEIQKTEDIRKSKIKFESNKIEQDTKSEPVKAEKEVDIKNKGYEKADQKDENKNTQKDENNFSEKTESEKETSIINKSDEKIQFKEDLDKKSVSETEIHKVSENSDKEKIRAELKKVQDKYNIDDDQLKTIIKSIVKADVPVNAKNIAAVAEVYDKIGKLEALDDNAVVNIIKNSKDINFENIYIAKHTPKVTNNKNSISENVWKQLEKEIVKLFERENIEVSRENIDIARLFIKNEIPVTKENIEKALFLKDISNKVDIEKVIFKAAENIKLDKRAGQTELFDMETIETSTQKLFEDYKEIIKVIPQITTEVIERVIGKGEKINLKNLKDEVFSEEMKNEIANDETERVLEKTEIDVRKENMEDLKSDIKKDNIKDLKSDARKENTENLKIDVKKENTKNLKIDSKKENDKKLEISDDLTNEIRDFKTFDKNRVENKDNNSYEKIESNYESGEISLSPEVITAKRQIAEIQLKLTSEAAVRLAGKGIDINIVPIKQAVEELRKIESEIYKSNLNIMGAEPTKENVEKMNELYSKLESLAPVVPSSVYREIINNTVEFTIDGIDTAVKADTTRIIDTLDVFATVPEQRFGDSYSSVQNQLADVLSLNNIPVTEENLSAAKILSLNNMDVNEDNIMQTKVIDFKINKTYNNLHPLIAADMIREGLNPIDMNLDDVIDYIDKFDDKYGQDSRDKIAENIMELRSNENISAEEKEAVTAVYRMLSMISKHGNAAVGMAVRNNMELTLGNLMESAKVFEKSKRGKDFNVEVSDSFGEVDVRVVPEKNIRASIGRAINNRNNSNENNAVPQNENSQMQQISDSLYKPMENVFEYSKMIFDEVIKNAEPLKLLELIKSDGNLAMNTVEQLLTKLKKAKSGDMNVNINRENIKAALEQIKQISESPANVIQWMSKNDIPLTMSNFSISAGIIKNPFKTGKDLEKFEGDSKENKISFGKNISSAQLEQLKNGKTPEDIVNDLVEEIDETVDTVMATEGVDEIDLLLKQSSNLKKALKVQGTVNRNEDGLYQLPMRLSDGSITTLNMYVTGNGFGDDFKTFMSFETSNLGTVQVFMSMADSMLNLKINSDSDDGIGFLSLYGEGLKHAVAEAGFSIAELSFGKEESSKVSEDKSFKENLQENVKIFNNLYEIIV